MQLLLSIVSGFLSVKWMHKALLAVGGLGLLVLYTVFKTKQAGRRRDARQRLKAIKDKQRITRDVDATVKTEDHLADLLAGRGYDGL